MEKLKETGEKKVKYILDQRGSAAVLTVIILFTFVVTVLFGAWKIITVQAKISVSSRQELQAWYEAESQLESVIVSLQEDCSDLPSQASATAGSNSNAAAFLYDIDVQGTVEPAVKNILARVRITYDPVQYLYQVREDNKNTAGAVREVDINGSLGIDEHACIFIKTCNINEENDSSVNGSAVIGNEDFIGLQWPGDSNGTEMLIQKILLPYYGKKLRDADEMGQSSEPLIYIADSNINLHSIDCCRPDILVVRGTVYITDDFLPENEQGLSVMPVIIADRAVIDARQFVQIRAYLLAREHIRISAGTRAEIDGRILTDVLQIGGEEADASLSITADSSCRPQYLRPDVEVIYCREKNDLCK